MYFHDIHSMASQDIIELGSSDEEVEPAQKKFVQSKKNKSIRPNVPNAMVHIPNNFSGVKIKSTPLVKNSKFNTSISPVSIKAKFGPGSVIKQLPIPPNLKFNPLSFKRISELTKPSANQICTKITPVPIEGPKVHQCLKSLPPGITVTKMGKNGNSKRSSVSPLVKQNNSKKPAISLIKIGNKKRPSSSQLPSAKKICKDPLRDTTLAVGTAIVGLDDDDSSCTNALSTAPKWYKNPENLKKNAEEANNKEPEVPKFVEIVIQDSPVKPLPSKRKVEVESDLCITVEDSPKAATDKVKRETDESGSDDENHRKKVPNSKKKLNYPGEDDNSKPSESTGEICPNIRLLHPDETIELEIETINTKENINENKTVSSIGKNAKSKTEVSDIVIEIEESPLKQNTEPGPSSKIVSLFKSKFMDENDANEYSQIYLKFIELCFQLENTEDMKKIVDKKIKSYYKQVPKKYTESEEFCDLVSSKIFAMKTSPDKMYLYIKDIVDELNLQRKLAKSRAVQEEKQREAEAAEFYGQEIEQDSRRKRQIRKLEKTLKKLHRAVQKLEEQEVDFDDDGDSVYILTERYKDRLVRVHSKLCQLSNTKMPSEPKLHLEARAGRAAGPARRLERWVNRRGPAGAPLPFPDFHDVLKCVRDANAEDKLGWNEADIMEEARDLFTRCGRKLQRRRQENEWRIAASRLPPELDPVDASSELKQKLENNKQVAAQKETELINKFADRQNMLKLEAVEIGDKEAEESPEESGDEAPEDDAHDESTCLENKEERKQRLKRLLKEKSRKTTLAETIKEPEKDFTPDDNNDKAAASTTDGDKQMVSAMDVDEDIQDTTLSKSSESREKPSESRKDSPNKEKLNQSDSTEDKNNKSEVVEDVELLSDDSNKVDSDIDELHLLQKLHSEAEGASSSLDSAGSPVAISDTPEDNDDGNYKLDIVSIENSSYSESELKEDNEEDVETCDISSDNSLCNEETMQEINEKSPKIRNNSNDEYGENVENILLASSDDEGSQDKQIDTDSQSDNVNVCLNLKDDSISIGETVIEESSMTSETEINDTAVVTNRSKEENKEKENEVTNDTPDVEIEIVPESNTESTIKQKVVGIEVPIEFNADLVLDCPNTNNTDKPLNEIASDDETISANVTNTDSASENVCADKHTDKTTVENKTTSLLESNKVTPVKQTEGVHEVDTDSSANVTKSVHMNGSEPAEDVEAEGIDDSASEVISVVDKAPVTQTALDSEIQENTLSADRPIE